MYRSTLLCGLLLFTASNGMAQQQEEKPPAKETTVPSTPTGPPAQEPARVASTVVNAARLQTMVTAKSVFLLIANPPSADIAGEPSTRWWIFRGPFVKAVPQEAGLQVAYKELTKAVQKWNRFVIVDDVSKADLVLLVVEWEDLHRWGRTVACRDWLLVFDGGVLPTEESQPVWVGDREQWGKWGGCSGAGQPVKELRKEIERAEKAAKAAERH